MVIFKEGDTEEQTMEGLYNDLVAAKEKTPQSDKS
jgi:hypothetical protein